MPAMFPPPGVPRMDRFGDVQFVGRDQIDILVETAEKLVIDTGQRILRRDHIIAGIIEFERDDIVRSVGLAVPGDIVAERMEPPIVGGQLRPVDVYR